MPPVFSRTSPQQLTIPSVGAVRTALTLSPFMSSQHHATLHELVHIRIRRLSDCLDHSPKILKRGIKLDVMRGAENQAPTFPDGSHAFSDLPTDIILATEWQRILLIDCPPEAKAVAKIGFDLGGIYARRLDGIKHILSVYFRVIHSSRLFWTRVVGHLEQLGVIRGIGELAAPLSGQVGLVPYFIGPDAPPIAPHQS